MKFVNGSTCTRSGAVDDELKFAESTVLRCRYLSLIVTMDASSDAKLDIGFSGHIARSMG